MATLTDLSEALLGQWADSPRLRAVVTDVITPIRDEAVAAAETLTRMADPDTAEGVWLDRIGSRIGLPRPFTTDSTLDRRFGFDDAGRPFDQAPSREPPLPTRCSRYPTKTTAN